MAKTYTLEEIHDMLTGQRFANWYNTGDFDKYIQQDEGSKSKDEILVDLAKLLG